MLIALEVYTVEMLSTKDLEELKQIAKAKTEELTSIRCAICKRWARNVQAVWLIFWCAQGVWVGKRS